MAADTFRAEGRKGGVRPFVMALKVLCLAAVLLWPAAYFGRPAFLDDSPGYDASGGFALRGAGKLLAHLRAPPAVKVSAREGAPTAIEPRPQASTKGQRSIPYGVFVHLLSGPDKTFVFLILAQSLLLAWVIVVTTETVAPGLSARAQAVGVAGLAALTTAPWIASFAIPDVFAPILVLGLLLLAQPKLRLSLLAQLTLMALTAFAISSHASHPPIALAMLAVLGPWAAWNAVRRRQLEPLRPFALCLVPVFLGMLATSATLYVGYGEASVTGKHFPMALARSIEDGPARWYLDKECKSGRRYEVCEFFSPMPTGVGQFLWGPGGLVARANAEQMDRIRAEEPVILEEAVRAYPVHQAAAALENFGAQLIQFRAPAETGILYDRIASPSDDGTALLVDAPARPFPATPIHLVQYAAVLAGLLLLALRLKSLPPQGRVNLAMLGAALIVNAAVCGVLSAPADRYEARVIWLVPFFAALLWTRSRHADAAAKQQSLAVA